MDKRITYSLYISIGLNLLLIGSLIFLILNKKQLQQIAQPEIQDKTAQEKTIYQAPPIQTSSEVPTQAEQTYGLKVFPTSKASQYLPYTNTELNFKVNYPNTLEKPNIEKVDRSQNRPDIAHINFYYKGEKEAWDECVSRDECLEGGPDYITISIFTNPQKLSPKDWVIQNSQTSYIYTNSNYLSSNLENLIVDGQEAVKYSWSGLGGADQVVFTNKSQDLVYQISAGYMEDSSIRGDIWYFIDSFTFLK